MKENEWHELVYDEEQLKNLIINIGKNVKAERESKNYSISQLCERANISSLHLCRIEKGVNPISVSTLIKISIALNIPVTRLIPETLEQSLELLERLEMKKQKV